MNTLYLTQSFLVLDSSFLKYVNQYLTVMFLNKYFSLTIRVMTLVLILYMTHLNKIFKLANVEHINDLAQDCGNSSANALELPQSCADKPLIYSKTKPCPLTSHIYENVNPNRPRCTATVYMQVTHKPCPFTRQLATEKISQSWSWSVLIDPLWGPPPP